MDFCPIPAVLKKRCKLVWDDTYFLICQIKVGIQRALYFLVITTTIIIIGNTPTGGAMQNYNYFKYQHYRHS